MILPAQANSTPSAQARPPADHPLLRYRNPRYEDDGVARVLFVAELLAALRALRAVLAAGLAARVPAALLCVPGARGARDAARGGVYRRVCCARGRFDWTEAAAPLLRRGRHAAGYRQPLARGHDRLRAREGAQQWRALQYAAVNESGAVQKVSQPSPTWSDSSDDQLHEETHILLLGDDALATNRECVTRALICLFNLAIALESLVAVLVIDSEDQYKSSSSDKGTKQQGLSASLVTMWILLQYASFGVSVAFAAAVWIAESSRALLLLSNALFFALYGLQWLALSICTFVAGYSTTGIVFAVLAVHPLAGFLISRSSGRQAREEAERQEALEITFEHEEESTYHHCAEV